MKLTTGQRSALLLAAGVSALALVLSAKYVALPSFLDHRVAWGLGSMALLAGTIVLVARFVRASGLQLVSVLAPLVLILFVVLVVSPLPFEVARQARILPHPAGETVPPYVTTIPFFDAGHPVAIATFTYAPGRNVSALADESEGAFRAAGWATDPRKDLESRSGPFSIVSAHKGQFLAYCTIGDPDGTAPTIACNVSLKK